MPALRLRWRHRNLLLPALAAPDGRVSRDSSRTTPPVPPAASRGTSGQPCTIPVFHPASGTGRMLVLTLTCPMLATQLIVLLSARP